MILVPFYKSAELLEVMLEDGQCWTEQLDKEETKSQKEFLSSTKIKGF